MKNIILTGMPACGKSVAGVILAKVLRMKFIDTDLLIQEKEGAGLQDIIDKRGIEYFMRTEEEILSSLKEKNAVIATGGSAVYYPQAMAQLKKTGIVVYIEAPLEEIKKRLRNIKTRGVAMEKGQTIEELYRIRKPLYEKFADITVTSDKNSPEITVENIKKKTEALLKSD